MSNKAIKARLKAATKGPLRLAHDPEGADSAELFAGLLSHGSGLVWHVMAPEHPKTIGGWEDEPEHAVIVCTTGNGPTSKANAELYAHAPEDLRRLLDENERMEKNATAREGVMRRQLDQLRTAERERDDVRNALEWKTSQWTADGDEENGWCPEHPLRLQMDTGPHIPGYDCDDGKDECLPCMVRRLAEQRAFWKRDRDEHKRERQAAEKEITRLKAEADLHYPGELRAFYVRVRTAAGADGMKNDCEMVAQEVERMAALLETP